MTPDSFANALQHLDPGSRALLDLSLRRGLDDAEIADLLGADSDYVSSSREAAISQLAEDLGMHGDPEAVREALLEMPEDAWRRQPEMAPDPAYANGNGNVAAPSVIDNPTFGPEDEADAVAPRVTRVPSPVLTRGSLARRPVSSRGMLAGVLLIAAMVAVVLAVSGGSSSHKTSSVPTPAAPKAAPSKPSAGKSASLTSLGRAARGSATLDGRRLTLKVAGLPQPQALYEVWLYNDEIDAVPVTTFHSATATVKAKLPAAASGYRYLDVSLEPQDGNPNHSGDSILRVPLSSLR